MLITIGSKNRVKVQAVEEVLKDYPTLEKAELVSFPAVSEVSDQPISLREIIQGAKNRAKHAYLAHEHCSYSFGIESGLYEAPGTETGFLEATICAIFDGTAFHIGQSCGFEIPQRVLDRIFLQKMDLQEACLQVGLTNDPKLGQAEGIIGILTKGRIDRKIYTKQAIVTALIQLENRELYFQEVTAK